MKHLDLFSGIGGFALACKWVWGDEYENIGHSEVEKYACKVYHRHFPESKCFGDIRNIRDIGTVDLITGGFPCQPFSVAGKRRGKEDDRHLWPEMRRVIGELHPNWVLGENVAGIVNVELDQVLFDLENEGYETSAFIIPACGVDAPHKRDRVWIVARDSKINGGGSFGSVSEGQDTESRGVCDGEGADVAGNGISQSVELSGCKQERRNGFTYRGADVADTEREGLYAGHFTEEGQTPRCSEQQYAVWSPEPNVGRVAHGVPSRVDRLKGLGNTIVPQVAEVILRAMKEVW